VYDWIGVPRAWLYKNGDFTPLGTDAYPASRSITVSGGDVYILGNERLETNRAIQIPVLWKNGVKTRLTDGGHSANA
jgi:hypothetical protein